MVMASDASEEGGGVVHTEVAGKELDLLTEHVGVKGGNVAPRPETGGRIRQHRAEPGSPGSPIQSDQMQYVGA